MRLKLAIRGAVQGVGFRPFVYRLAEELGFSGWVNNSSQGVFIEVEGPRSLLQQFLIRLEQEKPPHSFVQSLETSWLDPVGYEGFEIRESEIGGDKTALVLPDIATCPDCLREIFDPTNRRFRYPFTNCTNCGPRFSIIKSLPYDRANTSMKSFTMCPYCQAEYDEPRNRRFHAQPNACTVCGPRLEFWDGRTGVAPVSNFRENGDRRDASPTRHNALLATCDAIRLGQIAAVKGIGGFHLVVDARNDEAVRRLRERKQREEKPLALMFPSLESVKSVCEVTPSEARLLRAPEAPIVLLKRLVNRQSPIANPVAPGNPNLGVMLPYTPLHHLLMAELGFPVVATSGNLSDEPICTDEHEALERLRDIADVLLVHNRRIVRHVDDSIVRVMLDREMVLRRARGYAPLPVMLGTRSAVSQTLQEIGDVVERGPTILAVGAHLKNTVALAAGKQVFISQHIGDLEIEQASNAFRRVAADLPRLYAVQPEIVAADLHPDYLSTKFADHLCRAETWLEGDAQPSVPAKIGVQHHIAHVLSCMAENELESPALGVAWDGTGYGLDGTIWGGEFFLVTEEEVERVAHLRPFRLPGGDTAVKEPRRAALGLLHEMFGEEIFNRHNYKSLQAFTFAEVNALKTMLSRSLNSPSCCSAGRLFDAVASLIGLRQQTRFEGQAAMELEFALEEVQTDDQYDLPLATRHSPIVLDWSPMIKAILADLECNVSVAIISARFHNASAEAIVAVAKHVGEPQVALSGGCFQNRCLTERTVKRLREEGFQPYWHQRVPPNDGGIALGQVIAARRELADGSAAFTPLQRVNNEPLSVQSNSLPRTLKRAEAHALSRITQDASR